MGRRAKPSKGKAEAKRPLARTSAKDQDAQVRDLEQRLAEALEREAAALSREAVAHEKQAATADILRVISSSPTDVQPVFDAIVRAAVQLCHAVLSNVQLFDGQLMDFVAQYNMAPAQIQAVHELYPMPPNRSQTASRAVLDRAVIHVPDVLDDPEYLRELAVKGRFRSVLSVPMMGKGRPIGAITVGRMEAGLFSETEITLLQTFADQAVIAIENVRLFTELQTSNRDLTTALDTQTATADILRIISGSRADVQPVFDAIVASAVRLLHGYFGAMTRVVGDRLERVAATSTPGAEDPGVRAAWSVPLDGESVHAKAIHDGAPVNIADALTEPGVSDRLRAVARGIGYRSLVAVPLLRHNEAIGTIAVTRREPGGFTDDEIALLKTFADQAVIAIEDARLLTELQTRTAELTRSVGQLTALGEVGQAVSSTLDLETVLTTIVTRAAQLAGTDGGAIYEYDEAAEEFRLRAEQGLEGVLVAARREVGIRRGEGAVGGLAVTRVPIQFADIAEAGAYEGRLRDMLLQAGVRSLLAVPVLREDRLVGGLVVNRKRPGTFAPEVVELLETFATQSALAIQNARLFREIEAKSRELEVASRHKSEFLANMSHELRTPLNAIIGYSELLEEEAGDLDGGRLVPDLQKIAGAAKHQLSLINDILDLSKIEAGRMELEVTDFDLPSTIDNALTLVRERATRRGITLERAIDDRVGPIRGDERKVKQVLLNLLSNALKFTPEGGRIEVRASVNEAMVEVSVTDTGVGIAPEDQAAVFEEFRQVGAADKKVEGTGLGLALCRRFVELHGGRIWVTSQVGQGATFTFTLPVQREE